MARTEIKETPPVNLVPVRLTLYLNPVDNSLWADKGPLLGWNRLASTPEVMKLIAAIPAGGGTSGITQAQMDTAITALETKLAGIYKPMSHFPDAFATLSFPSVPANSATASLSITVPLAASGDRVVLGLPGSANSNLTFRAVALDGSVAIRAYNGTTAAIAASSSGTFKITIIKPNNYTPPTT